MNFIQKFGDTIFFNNHCNNNKYNENECIVEFDKLHKGNYYINIMTNHDREYKDVGKFIGTETHNSGSFHIAFDIGYARYSHSLDELKIQKTEYHFQPHMTSLSCIRPIIYNYYLDDKLQKHIKLIWKKKYLLRVFIRHKYYIDVLKYIWEFICE